MKRFNTMIGMLLLLASLAGSLRAGEPGARYRRASQPKFNSKTVRGEHTRLILEKMEMKNNALTALVVREREILYGLKFNFATPPEMLRTGDEFELPVTLTPYGPGAGDPNRQVVRLVYVQTPEKHFAVTGFPLVDHPEAFDITELRLAGGAGDVEAPVTQKLKVRLVGGEAKSLVIGYIIQLGWDTDRHEIRVQYAFKRGKGWWSRAAPGGPQAPVLTGGERSGVKRPSIPEKPWLAPHFANYFSEYLANLNGAIRSDRGVDWSVDAWGREVGPNTTLTVRPSGSWANPNHYQWTRNTPYDFYALPVREYFRVRLEGKPVSELLE